MRKRAAVTNNSDRIQEAEKIIKSVAKSLNKQTAFVRDEPFSILQSNYINVKHNVRIMSQLSEQISDTLAKIENVAPKENIELLLREYEVSALIVESYNAVRYYQQNRNHKKINADTNSSLQENSTGNLNSDKSWEMVSASSTGSEPWEVVSETSADSESREIVSDQANDDEDWVSISRKHSCGKSWQEFSCEFDIKESEKDFLRKARVNNVSWKRFFSGIDGMTTCFQVTLSFSLAWEKILEEGDVQNYKDKLSASKKLAEELATVKKLLIG